MLCIVVFPTIANGKVCITKCHQWFAYHSKSHHFISKYHRITENRSTQVNQTEGAKHMISMMQQEQQQQQVSRSCQQQIYQLLWVKLICCTINKKFLPSKLCIDLNNLKLKPLSRLGTALMPTTTDQKRKAVAVTEMGNIL